MYLLGMAYPNQVQAQCSAGVPTFNVDLTGDPDSTWLSPPTVRSDTCCGVTAPDRCVYFIVTLDSNANGIIMDIPEGGGCGARPTGSLFYQVNCGPQIPIGTPVCLSGPGPHNITFCKPGNNANCYQITSFPGPSASGDVVSQDGCSAQLSAAGYDEASIVWSSVPSNPIFESFLDCTVGCDTVTATYQSGAPAFVDYEVCGAPIGGCDTTPYCDTMRVSFVSAFNVVIQPDSPTVCFGAPNTQIWAVPSGGAAPYTYQWTTLAGTPIGNTDTIAVPLGTYIVEATDTLACAFVRDTVVVTEFANPILSIPGNDSVICGLDPIILNGAIQAASGGIWTTGNGTFIPNRTTLNAQYIPTTAEYAAGSVSLTLLTTGNGTCPPDSNSVVYTLSPRPVPLPSGPSPVCEFTGGHTYSSPAVAGHTYLWTVIGGNITSGQGSNSIDVFWNAAGAGSVSLTQTNPDGCDSTVSFAVTIDPKPDPIITGVPPFCEWSTGNPYSVTGTAGHSYVWTVTGGSIASGQGTNAITVDFGTAGPATIQVTETNSFGCDTTVAIAFNINANPNPVITGSDTVCAFTNGSPYSTPNVAGHTYIWNVSGGTIGSGQNTNAIQVNWGAAGIGLVEVTQTSTNGCDTTFSFPVTILPNPVSAITGPDSVCQFDAGVAYATPGAPGNTYTWTVVGGSITSGQGSTTISVDWGAPALGTVTLVETTPLGCDTSVVYNVVISPKPNPVITGSPPFCEFSTGIPYSTPAVAGNSYVWTVNGGSISTGQGSNAITVTWGGAGPGNVQVTESNPQGCDTTVSIAIVINPTPTPTFTGPDSLCEYASGIVYTAASNPGNSYVWTVNGGSIASGQGTTSITVDWGAAGVGSVAVTETSPIGCDSTLTLAVTLLPKPDPIITGPAPVCEFDQGAAYSVIAVAGDAYAWTVSGGSIVSGQGSNSINVDWGGNGAGSLSLTQTTPEGCDTTVTLAVTIQPRPDPSITGPDTVCAFSNGVNYATLNVPGNTYNWSVTGGTIASGQGSSSINVDWGSAGAGTVAVNESSPLGCDTTEVLNVTILPNPQTQITGPASVCEFSTQQYSATNIPGDSYVWTVSGGNILSGQGTPNLDVDWGSSGSGSVQLTQITTLGCDTTILLNVTIHPNPSPAIALTPPFCEFSTGVPYSTPFTTGHSYVWAVNGGTISSGQGSNSIVVTWGSAGAGSVTVTETNVFGCDTTVSIPVTISPTPTPALSGPDSICEFSPGIPYSVPSTPGNTYTWNVLGGSLASGQGSPNITVNWGSSGTGTVSLTEISPIGCDSTVTLNVTLLPNPDPVIAGPSPVCEFDLGAVYSVAAVPGDGYAWTVVGGTIVAGQGSNAITVDWGANGLATVELTQTTPEGCDTTVSVSFAIHPRPNPNITGAQSLCEFSGGIAYSTGNIPGNTYSWTVLGGNIIAGQGTNSIVVDWLSAGTASVAVTETSPLGCDTTELLTVVISPNPQTELIGPSPVCAYSSTGYAATAAPGDSYVWTVVGGTITSGQGTPNIDVTWGAPSNGSVQLVQTTALGCDTTMLLTMQVLPAPEPVVTGPIEVCQFSQGNAYSTPFVNGTNYSWAVNGGTITAGQNTPDVQVTWNTPGIGELILTAVTNTGCDTTVVYPVTILPSPTAIISPQDTFGCGFLEAQFSAATSPNATNFFWDFGNGQTSFEASPTATYTTTGTFDVTLIVSNSNGCADTAGTQVFITPGPIASFIYEPASPVNIENDSLEWANNSLLASNYFWDFGDGNLDTAFIPVHQYDTLGDLEIQLIAVDSFGCADTTVRPITLVIDVDIFIPNAFTPNGDLLNDSWSVVSRNLTDFQVQIFSRWGELMFESFDPNFEWNGDYQGQPCQEGVYVWKINATFRNSRRYSRSGTVTLYR